MMAKINLMLLGVLIGLGGISYALPKMIRPPKPAIQKMNLAKGTVPSATSAVAQAPATTGAAEVTTARPVEVASATNTTTQKFVDPVVISAPADKAQAKDKADSNEGSVAVQTPPVPQPSILKDIESKKEPVFENWANADYLPKDDDNSTYHPEENLDLEDQVSE